MIALLVIRGELRGELMNTRTILKSNLDGIALRLSNMDDRITNLSAKQREQTENLSDFSLELTGLAEVPARCPAMRVSATLYVLRN